LSRGNILVVEKDPFYSSLYQKILSAEGYRVYLANGVPEGLKLFTERAYDVVISDMVLKGEDGLALLQEIRKSSPRQDVIMITSMQSIKKAVEALKLGAADYLTKPVDGDELLLLLKNLIDRQNISAEHSRLVSENVLFFEQFRIQKRGLEILSMLDMDRIIDHLLDIVIEETRAGGAALWFFDEIDGEFRFGASRGTYNAAREEADRLFRSVALREQFLKGRALLLDEEGTQFPEGALDSIAAFRIPLFYGGRVTGSVTVTARHDHTPYKDYDVNLVRVLIESGAVSLQNARFFSLEASRELRDPDTEIYSPAYFHQAGMKEVNIARRSLVCVELDGFTELKKKIKETQARRLIKDVAEILLEVSRETDVLSMLEEGIFALVIPETDFYGALMLIKRIKVALRKAVFAIDLKRELRLDFSLGSATYPNDGEQLVTLLRSARGRMRRDRESLVRELKLENWSFWKAFAHLVELYRREDRHTALENSFLSLKGQEVDQIRNLFLDEASRLGNRRGLLYVGNQTVDSSLFDYSGFSRLAASKLSIFTLGERGSGTWNHPEIMPVYLDDRDIRANRFLLCIAESFYYTLLCRPDGDNNWRAFHSSDPHITHEMIGKLQERYLLQQRIG
jgi:diguanylate cyclase (GGDEF)-like protein